MVELRDHYIHEMPPLFSSTIHKNGIRRRNKDERDESYMLRKLLIFFSVALEMLVLPTLHASIDILYAVILGRIVTLDHEEVLVMCNDMPVDIGKTTVTEREIIYRVQDVGLALPVTADEAIDLGREVETRRTDILIVDDGNMLKYHSFAPNNLKGERNDAFPFVQSYWI